MTKIPLLLTLALYQPVGLPFKQMQPHRLWFRSAVSVLQPQAPLFATAAEAAIQRAA